MPRAVILMDEHNLTEGERRLPNLPDRSMAALARIVGHMTTGSSLTIQIHLHQGGVRGYSEVVYPLSPEGYQPSTPEGP